MPRKLRTPDCGNGPLYNEIDDRISEDWEATGQEEMNRLYENVRQEPALIIDVRDRLCRISDLVDTCVYALIDQKEARQNAVAAVLNDFVREEIKTAEQELASL